MFGKKLLPWMASLGLTLVLLSACAVPAAAPQPLSTGKVIIAGDTLTLTDPVEMEFVRVPAGEFMMGSDKSKDPDAYDRELPQHSVNLPEFFIGKYEVTNAQYEVFVEATGHTVPGSWENGSVPTGLEEHPVVAVSWDDAVAFTEWLSDETDIPFRLPTEAEWEKACRGTDTRHFPWGNSDPNTEKLNSGESRLVATTSVGSYSPQGDSPYGAVDMAGNVWEWVADWYGSEYYEQSPADSPQGPDSGTTRVLRGGSFYDFAEHVRCAYRFSNYPSLPDVHYGFRVVASP